jgi:hypothetical protein
MLDKGSLVYERVADLIESFMAIDLTGTGIAARLHSALQARQGRHPCMDAAELLKSRFADHRSPALIVTGFPQGGGVPETDGPIGAALLARALFLAFNVESVIVVDEGHEEMMKATCIGAGLIPLPFPADGVIRPVEFARPVYVRSIPVDSAASQAVCDALLDVTRPAIAVAIERPGANDRGLYSGFGGRSLDGMVADLDYLVRGCGDRNVPFIGVGDGGNELGMGLLADDLKAIYPKAIDAGKGRGGVAAVACADHVVFSSVSNWAITGVIAALAALLENPLIFHDPEVEARCVERCCASGCVDGITSSPDHIIDGVPALEWSGLNRALKGALRRTMGDTVSWNGQRGNWMQVK